MTPDPAPARADAPARPRRLLMGAVAAAAGLAGMGVAWWRQPQLAALPGGHAADAGTDADAGDPLAPLWALTVPRPEGGELAFGSLRGRPLLVNFWATWCPPCVKEMPEIDRFHQAFGPRGWQVVGLAIDGPTPVREFLAKVKVGFPIGLAGLDGTALVRSLGNPQGGLPFTVMIGAKGQVLQRKLGETHYDELAGWAAKA